MARQLLTESALLSGLGGAFGLLVANWAISVLPLFVPAQALRFDGGLDSSVLAFTAALSFMTGLVVGIVPIWRITKWDLHLVLREATPSASRSLRQHRFMQMLAMGQVTVSLVLLVGAGLMIETLERLQAIDLGFNPDRLLTFYVALPEAQYSAKPRQQEFFRELLARIRALPEVHSASAINALYVHWSNAIVVPVNIEGRPAPDRSRPPDTHVRIVDPDIHRVLEVPILRGHSFMPQDGRDARQSVVINDAMARRYFPGENPIGQRISVLAAAPGQPLWQEIVGVVGDVRQKGLDAEAFPEIQVSYTQSSIGQMAILVRAAAEPTSLVPSIRAQLQSLDANLPMTFMQTMEDILEKSFADRRFGMRLLSAFGSVALLLTAIGLYGVMTAAVSDRTREIAVRLALGAPATRIVRMVVGQTFVVVIAGLAAGIGVALGTMRSVEPLLFGVARTDPTIYAETAGIFLVVTLVSAYVPSRRVVRVNPVATLRSE